MKRTRKYAILLPISLGVFVSIAVATSKISDDAYRLVRQLVSYIMGLMLDDKEFSNLAH
jgi:hypothetical protein